MVIDRTFHIAAPPQAVWGLIKDVPALVAHIPGAQALQSLSERAHAAGVTLNAGPLKGTYTTSLNVQSIDDQNRAVVVQLVANDTAGRGGITATVTARVESAIAGSQIAIHADIEGSGQAAGIEQHLAQSAAPNADSAFVANIERALKQA
ncbi:MAG: SRPBCC family protein [Candidatus Eremiobacteraeota bacterium]|nr:SRPBCC family protein [Candidatus Eremiobacteraeota bacterium]MBV8281978.1 SRPBCC family protein [Candidatus Eremiobacteraeota bacterium]